MCFLFGNYLIWKKVRIYFIGSILVFLYDILVSSDDCSGRFLKLIKSSLKSSSLLLTSWKLLGGWNIRSFVDSLFNNVTNGDLSFKFFRLILTLVIVEFLTGTTSGSLCSFFPSLFITFAPGWPSTTSRRAWKSNLFY